MNSGTVEHLIHFHLPNPSESSDSSSSESSEETVVVSPLIKFHLPDPNYSSSSVGSETDSESTVVDCPIPSMFQSDVVTPNTFHSVLKSPLYSPIFAFSPSHFETPLVSNCTSKAPCSLSKNKELTPLTKNLFTSSILSTLDDEVASLQGYVFVDAEDVSAGTSNSGNATNIPNNNLVNVDDFDVGQMAKDVYNLGCDADMTSEELELIRTSTVNTKKYEKSKNGIEERFF